MNPNPSVTSDITNMEESSYKVGKLSVEQRKEKIHRYLKKRNERNFSKKIKVLIFSMEFPFAKILSSSLESFFSSFPDISS